MLVPRKFSESSFLHDLSNGRHGRDRRSLIPVFGTWFWGKNALGGKPQALGVRGECAYVCARVTENEKDRAEAGNGKKGMKTNAIQADRKALSVFMESWRSKKACWRDAYYFSLQKGTYLCGFAAAPVVFALRRRKSSSTAIDAPKGFAYNGDRCVCQRSDATISVFPWALAIRAVARDLTDYTL